MSYDVLLRYWGCISNIVVAVCTHLRVVYVFMCCCMHNCMHGCTCTCTSVCIDVCMHVSLYVSMYMHMYECMHTVHAHKLVYVLMHAFRCHRQRFRLFWRDWTTLAPSTPTVSSSRVCTVCCMYCMYCMYCMCCMYCMYFMYCMCCACCVYCMYVCIICLIFPALYIANVFFPSRINCLKSTIDVWVVSMLCRCCVDVWPVRGPIVQGPSIASFFARIL